MTYRVLVAGLGKRGLHHATAFHANPRFQVVGLCDIDRGRAEAARARCGNPEVGADAAEMARRLRPDVFCFCTLPDLRLPMIRAGIEGGARLIAMEKPIALSSAEAMQIRRELEAARVKAVVSHQHRYGAHYRRVREIIASGVLGRIHTVYGTATGWLMHMASHLIDYMRWFNDEAEAEWVLSQAAGRGKLSDNHPSPDYLAGFIHFANGVRGIIECGAGAPDVPEVDYWWRKARIGAQGTEGFAEVLTGGGWRAVTRAGAQSGPGGMNYELDMPPYIQQIADWLDDETKPHPCRFQSAYKGHEILMALCRSAALGGQTALPLTEGADEIQLLRERLPERPVLFSLAASAEQYR